MNICVYGASSKVIDKKYIELCEELGRRIAKKGIGLVFGGGANGVMGAAARGAKSANGKIIGVAPSFFNVDGVLFEDCSEFITTTTMRERKQLLEDSSDGFIVAPGGMGTYEEFFEILTLKQLERHNKPIVIYNIDGFYDTLLKFFDEAIEKEFMKKDCRRLFKVSDDIDEIIDYIVNYSEEVIAVSELRNI